MTNLTIIYLQANCLTELPESIQYLVNLKILDVSCNDLLNVPSTIGHLKKLTKLVLTQNRIATLSDSIGQLTSLESLQLNFNNLQSLPYSLRNCTMLRELCIDRNNFQTLPNFLTRLPNLEVLSACGNQLIYLPLVPFAAIKRFYFDTNTGLSYLPYPLACQMNETSLNPFATESVLHIDCYGCFQNFQSDSNIYTNHVSVKNEGNDWSIHLPPCLLLSTSHVMPSLAELVLRSLVWRQFGKSVVKCGNSLQSVHIFRIEKWYGEHYDDWLETLHEKLPSTVIEFLRQGPTAFCFDCMKPIFNRTYPLFIPKMMMQSQSSQQRILCCLLFCSPICFQTYRRAADTWETLLLDTQLENWNTF